MSDSDSQQALFNEQQEHARQMKIVDRLHDLTVQGAKGLGVLNAGAAVAMLAFVQALVDKPAYLAFKPYVLGALSCFILGAFLATIIFFFHYKYLSLFYNLSIHMNIWYRAIWGC
jgi:hypothetical protein